MVKSAKTPQAVQTFGRKKTATAVAHVKIGSGKVKLNGVPIELFEPATLKVKVQEPLAIVGKARLANMDIRLRVSGGGRTAQAYALRQAIAKGILAYNAKYVDEATKREIKDLFLSYDRTLVVADPRRTEPKKAGGPGARARAQKSYR